MPCVEGREDESIRSSQLWENLTLSEKKKKKKKENTENYKIIDILISSYKFSWTRKLKTQSEKTMDVLFLFLHINVCSLREDLLFIK